MPYLGFKLQCREHQQPSPTAHGVHQTPPFFSASQGNCINLDTPREPFQLISTHLPKTDAERRAAATKQPQSLTPTLLLTAFIHPVPSRGSSSLLNHRAEGFIPILGSKHEADQSRSSNSRAQHLHQPHPPLPELTSLPRTAEPIPLLPTPNCRDTAVLIQNCLLSMHP